MTMMMMAAAAVGMVLTMLVKRVGCPFGKWVMVTMAMAMVIRKMIMMIMVLVMMIVMQPETYREHGHPLQHRRAPRPHLLEGLLQWTNGLPDRAMRCGCAARLGRW